MGLVTLHDVKRKPNTASHWGAAAATARILATPNEKPPCDDSPAIHRPTINEPVRRPGVRAPLIIRSAPETRTYQTRIPVITGEAHYKGTVNVEGLLSGQLGGSGGSLGVRQRSNASRQSEPELSGEISFRDMIRVNGHIAGTVHSKMGTLIVDVSAKVDADIEVAVAVVNGTVQGNLVAHERVEIGPSAKIYGSIWTRSIEIKTGAIFEGICTMLAEEQITG